MPAIQEAPRERRKPPSLLERRDGRKLLKAGFPIVERVREQAITWAPVTFEPSATEVVFDQSYSAPGTNITKLSINYTQITTTQGTEGKLLFSAIEKDGREIEALFDQVEGNKFLLTDVRAQDPRVELSSGEKRKALKDMNKTIKFVDQAEAASSNYIE